MSPVPMGFVISLYKQHKPLCLHFSGGCHRVPGTHYLRFRDCGQQMPPRTEGNTRCRDCFPADDVKQRREEEKEASGEDSALSSSSSSSEAEPQAE